MKLNTMLMVALAGCTTLIASQAQAQNLKDRIDHVMQERSTAEANNTSKAGMLGALLYSDVSVQFQETPTRDAINYLQTVLGINLVGRYNDDKTGAGLDPEAPITLNMSEKPALTVLEMILDQSAGDEEATWQLRDGYVEVGTKDRLSVASAREVRYYPIKDLLFEAPMFDNAPELDLDSALNQGQDGGGGGGGGGGGSGGGGGGSGGGSGGGGSIFTGGTGDIARETEEERVQRIIDLILETVEPDAWADTGGEYATIRYYSGTLIIRAPDYIHRQVGGYPFAARPAVAPKLTQAPGRRYVTFSAGVSNVQLVDFRDTRGVGGSAGGSGGSSSGGSTSGGSSGSKAKTEKNPDKNPAAAGDSAKKD
jgi:uncharacterized membrane protein YgcG